MTHTPMVDAGPTSTAMPPPVDPAGRAGVAGDGQRQAQAPKRPRARIMIVEDEALIALDLERRLVRLGYEVVGVADNHDDAVATFTETRPDLVLMDVFIQGQRDGIEVARTLSSIDDKPVVFLTAFADDKTIQRAAEVSPYGYLLKPFDERMLVATVTMTLERHASENTNRLLSAAIHSATVGILLVDVSGDAPAIVSVNDAFLHMSGATFEQVVSKPPCFLANNPLDEVPLRLREALHNRTHAEGVVTGRGSRGEPFWTSVVVSPVANRTGRITHMLLFHQDVTNQHRAEAMLAASQKLELAGHLSAGIAHDFNNLLTVIMSCVDHVRDSVDDPEIKAELDEALKAAERGGALTRQLLTFSRRTEDNSPTASDLGLTILDAQGMLRRLAGPRIKLDLQIDPEPTFVVVRPTAIHQVLLNLVKNARDAMPSGGQIRIATSQVRSTAADGSVHHFARLVVSDTGPGMDERTRDRAFEPLFTTKPADHGTGVGLYTTRMLLEQAGGSIDIATTPGEGCTFTIQLPLSEFRSTVAEEELPEATKGRAGGARCLLILDEPALRRACSKVLAEAGFELSICGSTEAVRKELEAAGRKVRLIVCDAAVAGLEVDALVAQAEELAPRAAVLVLNSSGDDSRLSNGTQHNILWKPFTASSLARRALDAFERGPDGEDEVSRGTRPSPALPGDMRAVLRQRNEQRRPKALVVDNDSPSRRAMRSALEQRGFAVVEAMTGTDAIARVMHEEDLHLCVLDVGLPDMDGLEVMQEIRRKDSVLPFIVVTGGVTVEQVQRSLRARVWAHLAKPVDVQTLGDEAERAIAEGQMARMRHDLLAAKVGSQTVLGDLATTDRQLTDALQTMRMAFQPIVRAHDLSTYGFEALMRPQSQALSTPPAVLTAAEVLSRVDDVGHVVRSRVADAIRQAPQRNETIFVNVHPLEFRPELLLDKADPLLPFASRVVLEVTERAQFGQTVDLAHALGQLRDAGFRIAVDDLGEGYSGLSWLVKLKPDIAKLDMSLVRDIHDSRTKRNLVASLVQFCRRAKITTLAEGVETEREAQTLLDLGCELMQGHYYAKPGPPFPMVQQRR